MIIVDTNVVAELMKVSPVQAVVSWMNDQESATLFLTTVSIWEIGYGLRVMPQGRRRLQLEQGFERVLAEAFCGLHPCLRRRGRPPLRRGDGKTQGDRPVAAGFAYGV